MRSPGTPNADEGCDPRGTTGSWLAHQWTGDSLSVAAWKEIWLNEGFATYAEWLWSEHEGGDSAQAIFDGWAGGPVDEFPWGAC